MHAPGCGHWMTSTDMKALGSACMAGGTCAGMAKVTRLHVRPASWVMRTTGESALPPVPTCCDTASVDGHCRSHPFVRVWRVDISDREAVARINAGELRE